MGLLVVLSCFVSESIKPWIFGTIRCYLSSALLFNTVGNDQTVLFWVVSFEYLGVGLGTLLLLYYHPLYAASQIALLSSLMGLTRSFSNATTGFLIEYFGYEKFFYLCTLLAIPGMILLLVVAPFSKSDVEDHI